jgi:hypothetical protein
LSLTRLTGSLVQLDAFFRNRHNAVRSHHDGIVRILTTDRQHIAPSKAWERGISNERMKPFERIQLVKVQSG